MKLKRMLCALLSAVLVLGMSPPLSFAATGETDEDASAFVEFVLTTDSLALEAQGAVTNTYDAELTFSDSAITETAAGAGYAIDGTALSISAAGTYRLTGSCSDGSIVVAKGLSGVTLVLDGLSLASSSTAPIVVKKGSTVTVHTTDGTTSTLTDNEDPNDEASTRAAAAPPATTPARTTASTPAAAARAA